MDSAFEARRTAGGASAHAVSAIIALLCALACLAAAPVLAAETPSNDSFTNAVVLNGNAGTAHGSSVGATLESGEPTGLGGSGIWYSFTPSSDGVLIVDTQGSDFDTVLDVFRGSAVDSLTLLASNDDYDGGQSRVTLGVSAGRAYMIRVGGYHGAQGSVTLNWSRVEAACITGSVTDKVSGGPLSGVDVTVYGRSSYDGWSSVASASTDASGSYDVSGLAPGTYRVSFSSADGSHVRQTYDGTATIDSGTDVVVAEGQTVSGIDASLGLAAHISGRVTDGASGGPLSGVDVTVYGLSGYGWWDPVASASTDASGAYSVGRLAPGTYRVEFSSADGSHVRQTYDGTATVDSGTDVVVAEGQTVSAIDASLRPAARITGRVTAKTTGEPVSDTEVAALGPSAYGAWEWVGWAVSDSSGSYEVGGLAPGTYRVRFWPSGGDYISQTYDSTATIGGGTDIVVAEGQTVSGIDAALGPAAHITGRVTARTTGEPLPDVRVAVNRPDGYGGWETVADSDTDPSGSYAVGGLAPGTYRVEFWPTDADHVRQAYDDTATVAGGTDIVVAEGQTVSGIDAALDPAAHITGRVTAKTTGGPLSNIQVAAYGADGHGGWNPVRYSSTDASGSYDTGGLAPGTYRVGFRSVAGDYVSQAYDDTATVAGGTDVVVAEGQTVSGIDAALAAAPSGHITGRVEAPLGLVSGAVVYAYRLEGASWGYCGQAQVAPDGSYDLNRLSSGTYRVVFNDLGGVYPAQVYNGVYTWDVTDARCSDIVLNDGQTAAGIDASFALLPSVSGRVTREVDSSPVAGELVTIERYVGSAWQTFATTSTASDGTYAFDGVPAGYCRVHFSSPTGLTLTQYYNGVNTEDPDSGGCSWIYRAADSSSIQDVNGVLRAPARVSGRVVDEETGSALTSATVSAYLWTGFWRYVKSAGIDSSGSYTLDKLDAGDYRVKFSDPSGEHVTECFDHVLTSDVNDSRCATVAVAAGQQVEAIDAAMSPLGRISGRATARESGEGLPSIQVRLYRWGGSSFYAAGSTVTTGSGDYTFRGLDQGRYRVLFRDPASQRIDNAFNNVDVGTVTDSRCTDIDLAVGQAAAGVDASMGAWGRIVGHVSAAGYGIGASGVTVLAYRWTGTSWTYLSSATVSSSGDYSVGGLDTGTYRVLFASSNGTYASQCYSGVLGDNYADPSCTNVPVTLGAVTSGIDAELSPSSLRGRVRAPDGSGAAGIGVTAYRWDGYGWWFVRSTTTGGSGDYDFGPLQSGTYRLYFSDSSNTYVSQFYDGAFGSSVYDSACDSVSVLLGAATSNIDATMRPYGRISGHVTSAETSAGVSADVLIYRLVDSNWAYFTSVATTGSGSYVVGGLPDGAYRAVFLPTDQAYFSESYDGVHTTDVNDSRCRSIEVTSGSTAQGVDATLEMRGRIVGHVSSLDSGEAIPTAYLYAYQHVGDAYEWGGWGQTDATGDYTIAGLSDGPYRLAAYDSSGGYLSACYPDVETSDVSDPRCQDVAVAAGMPAARADMRLRSASAIRGRVTADDGGEPLAGVYASAYRLDDGAWEMVSSVGTGTGAATAADGTYELRGLEPGEYRLKFVDGMGRCLSEFYDNVATDSVDDSRCAAVGVGSRQVVEGVDASLGAAGHIQGRVACADSTQSVPCDVYVYREEGNSEWTLVAWGYVGADGTYDIGGLRSGSYRVQFYSWGWDYTSQCYNGVYTSDPGDARCTAVVLNAPGVVSGIDATLTPAPHIRGRIVCPGNSHPWSMRATAYGHLAGNWVWAGQAMADATGAYDIAHLAPGEYRVLFEDTQGDSPAQCYQGITGASIDDPRCTTVAVSPTDGAAGIDATLTPGAHLGGYTLSSDGTALEGLIVDAFRFDGSSWISAGSAVSGSAGYYALPTLPTGEYRVRCTDPSGRHPATCFSSAVTTNVADPSCTSLWLTEFDYVTANIVMGTNSHLAGHVVDESSGAGVAGVYVQAFRLSGSSWTYEREAVSSSSGSYDISGLLGGAYRVRFYDSSNAYISEMYDNVPTTDSSDSRCASVTVSPESTTSGIDATLTPRAHMRGHVVGEDAPGGVGNIRVYAYKWSASSARWSLWNSVSTGATGDWDMGRLDSGLYRIRYYDPETRYLPMCYRDVPTSDVTDSRVTSLDVRVGSVYSGIDATLSRYGHIKGRVSSKTGAGLSGMSVQAYQLSGGYWYASSSAVTTSSGGYDIGGLAMGTYRVRFYDPARNYQGECYNDVGTDNVNDSRCADIDLSQSSVVSSVDATLTQSGHISGRLLAAETHLGLSGGLVAISRWNGNAWTSVGSQYSDAGGNYDINGLAPGDYRVSFDASGYLPQCYSGVPGSDVSDSRCTQVTVLEGQTAAGIDAELVKRGSLSGRVTSADTSAALSGILVTAYRWDGVNWVSVASAVTTASGGYQISNLPENLYRLRFSDGLGIYLTTCYDDVPVDAVGDLRCRSVAVVDGADTPGISAHMTTGGHILGRVVARDGSPLVHALVEACVWDGSDWGVERSSYTTASGGYDVSGLRADSYRIMFADDDGQFVTQCYDGVETSNIADSRCDSVTIAGSQSVRGINATLTPLGHITGRVTDAVQGEGLSGVGVTAFLWNGSSWGAWRSATTTASGGYDLSALPTGQYRLRYRDVSGAHLYGCYRDVSTSDVNDSRCTSVSVTAGTTSRGVDQTLVPVAPDAYESDDSMAQAPALEAGGTQQHLILPDSTVDWVKFDVQAAYRYRLAVAGPLAHAVALDLYSSAGVPLAHGAGLLDYFSLGSDTLYLRVSSSVPNSYGPYAIGLQTVQSGPPRIEQVGPASGSKIHGARQWVAATTFCVASVSSVRFEYSLDASATWLPLGNGVRDSEDYYNYSAWYFRNWDTTRLPDSEVLVRAVAVNELGQESTSSPVVSLSIDNSAPSTPTSFEAVGEDVSVALSWHRAPEADVQGYFVYRKEGLFGGYECVARIQELAWEDRSATEGHSYTYYVTAVDSVGNESGRSAEQSAAPRADHVPPVAQAGGAQTAYVNTPILFDGTGSTDDHGVVSYDWDYGDGAVGSGATAYHAYASPGTFVARLTVKDSHGNSAEDTASVTIRDADADSGILYVDAFEAGTAHKLANADVMVRLTDGPTYSGKTDTQGRAQFRVPKGTVEVLVYKDGYLPNRALSQVAAGSSVSAEVGLQHTDVLMGEVTVKRMTPEDMVKAGIDITNPANFNTSSFEIQWGEDTYTGICGREYTTSWGGGGWGAGSTITYGVCNGPSAGGVDAPRYAYVIVGGQTAWLKEMFDVSLTLKNLADPSVPDFTITDIDSTLRIPDGLSLAPMAAPTPPQTAKQTIAVLAPGEERTINWYLRGDRSGDYPVNVDVSGRMQPFGAAIDRTFAAADPIHVYGSGAVQTHIQVPKYVTAGQEFTVKGSMTNTSPVDVYLASARLTSLYGARLTSGTPTPSWDVVHSGETVNWEWTFMAMASGAVKRASTDGNVTIEVTHPAFSEDDDPVVSPVGNASTSQPVLVLVAGLNSRTGIFDPEGKRRGDPWRYLGNDGDRDLKKDLGVGHIMVVDTCPGVKELERGTGGAFDNIIDSTGSLDRNVDALITWLREHYRQGDFGNHSIILVGHSYGGVIARSMLADKDPHKLGEDDPIRAKIRGLVQFGSPNGGSRAAEVQNGEDYSNRASLAAWVREIFGDGKNDATFQLPERIMKKWNLDHLNDVGVPVVRLGGQYLPGAMDTYAYGPGGDNRIRLALGGMWKAMDRKPNDGVVSVDSLVDGNGSLSDSDRDFGSGWTDVPSWPILAHNNGVPGERRCEYIGGWGVPKGRSDEIVPQDSAGDLFIALNNAVYEMRASTGRPDGRNPASRTLHAPAPSASAAFVEPCTELPVRSVVVAAGAVGRFTLPLDTCTQVLVSSSDGTPSVAVRGPGGGVVTCPTASFADTRTATTVVEIDPTGTGIHTLDVSLPEGAGGEATLSGFVSGGASLELSAGQSAFAGSPEVLTASFMGAARRPLLGASLTGAAHLDGRPDIELAFRDDGTRGDAAAGDGVYTATFTPDVGGRWCATVQSAHAEAERAGSIVFDVGEPVCAVTGSPSETTTPGPGSTFASFGVALPIRVSIDGTYTVSGPLRDAAGAHIGMVTGTARLDAGESRTMVAAIAAQQFSGIAAGELAVGDLCIARSANGIDLAAGSGPGLTTSRSYAATDFYNFSVSLSGPASNPSASHAVHFDGTALDTSSTVSAVEYSLDGGATWHSVAAADGAFDSHSEDFEIDLNLPDYVYGLLVREIGADGTELPLEDWAGKRFTVDTVAPRAAEDLMALVATESGSPVARVSWKESEPSTDTASPVRYDLTLDGAAVGTTYGTNLEVGLPDTKLHVMTVTPLDGAGNTGSSTLTIVGNPPPPDTTPPVTTLHSTSAPNVAGWDRRDLAFDLSGADESDGSGVTNTYYTLNGARHSYTTTVTLDTEGVHAVEYWSKDASGNVETTKSATFKIDKTLPELSLDAAVTYTGAATIHALASDALSGLERLELKLDDEASWSSATQLSTSALGPHTVYARAFDVAGNKREVSRSFTVLASAPTPVTLSTTTKLSGPSGVKVRKSLKLTGTVSPSAAPGMVTITMTRKVGKKWKGAGSGRVTVARGKYSYSFKPKYKGSWRLVATYSGGVVGSTTYRGSKSGVKSVKVK